MAMKEQGTVVPDLALPLRDEEILRRELVMVNDWAKDSSRLDSDVVNSLRALAAATYRNHRTKVILRAVGVVSEARPEVASRLIEKMLEI